jgi:hypothetical protein
MTPALFMTLMLRVLPADTITKSTVSHQRGVLSLYLTDVFWVSLGLWVCGEERGGRRDRMKRGGGGSGKVDDGFSGARSWARGSVF